MMIKQKKKNMRLKQKKKLLDILLVIVIILVVVFVIELGYGIYSKYFTNEDKVYFDGLNSIVKIEKGYAAVGSNNNNDRYYERAKFSIYDKDREKTLEKIYNKGYNSAYFDLIQTSDGNYIAVGSVEIDKEQHENSVRTALLVKYDKDGNVLFEKKFSVLDNSKFTGVIEVSDGYFAIGQSIYSSSSVGTSSKGGAILVKYDKNGSKLWEKEYGDNKSAIFNDIILFEDSIIVVGKDKEKVGIIYRIDYEGNVLFSNDYKYTDTLGFSGLVELNGNVFVSTGKRITNDSTDGMIVKYDDELNYINEVSYDDGSSERFDKIIKDDKNHLITIGTKAIVSKKNKDEISDTNYDGIIAKYNEDLKELEVVIYGDEHDDYFNQIINDDKNYLVIGYSAIEDGSYLPKFIRYSDALKLLETE